MRQAMLVHMHLVVRPVVMNYLLLCTVQFVVFRANLMIFHDIPKP